MSCGRRRRSSGAKGEGKLNCGYLACSGLPVQGCRGVHECVRAEFSVNLSVNPENDCCGRARGPTQTFRAWFK